MWNLRPHTQPYNPFQHYCRCLQSTRHHCMSYKSHSHALATRHPVPSEEGPDGHYHWNPRHFPIRHARPSSMFLFGYAPTWKKRPNTIYAVSHTSIAMGLNLDHSGYIARGLQIDDDDGDSASQAVKERWLTMSHPHTWPFTTYGRSYYHMNANP